MSQDEKLDEALKGTFPASDAFYLSPDSAESLPSDQVHAHPALGLVEHLLDP
jgi:hypothetical protein